MTFKGFSRDGTNLPHQQKSKGKDEQGSTTDITEEYDA